MYVRVVAVILAALLAGCATPPSPGQPVLAMASPPPEMDDLRFTGRILGAEPLSAVDACSGACPEFHFELEHASNATVSLAWQMPLNDLDLYLFEGGAFVAMSRGTAPSTSEALQVALTPGAYRIQVVPFVSGPESFTIDVAFD